MSWLARRGPPGEPASQRRRRANRTMPSAQKAAEPEKSPAQVLMEANTAFVTTVVEAGYKAQTRSLNVARVLIEGAGRQQENGRRLVERLVDPALPPYSPERYTAFMNTLVENQN